MTARLNFGRTSVTAHGTGWDVEGFAIMADVSGGRRTDTGSRVIAASPQAIYRAFLDPECQSTRIERSFPTFRGQNHSSYDQKMGFFAYSATNLSP